MKKDLLLVVLIFVSMPAFSQQSLAEDAAGFLSRLSAAQRHKANLPFWGDERANWYFVPKDDRKGITLNEMNRQQQQAAFTLMQDCLGAEGYRKAREIMELENVLHELENLPATNHYRDPGKYFFTVFGTPSDDSLWGWRFEGHHLSFNFTSDHNKSFSGTPGFMGSNPAIVKEGPQKGKQVLKGETDKGFALLHSFSTEQRKKAIIQQEAPREIRTFNKRKAVLSGMEGISYKDMSASQQKLFMDLISTYIHRYTKLFSEEMMIDMKQAGLNSIHFAWAGSQSSDNGEGYYYCIHGPTIIIELDNTQNHANHVHTVVRDLKHDFGGDELLEHYNNSH